MNNRDEFEKKQNAYSYMWQDWQAGRAQESQGGNMKNVNQKILNRAWHHLLCQGAKSAQYDPEAGEEKSRYYGPRGLRCPIGCLITRFHYSPELESESPTSEPVLNAIAASLDVNVSDIDQFLIGDLASAHDYTEPRYWWSRLRRVAMEADLDFPERPGPGDRVKHWLWRRVTALRDWMDR